MFTIRDFRREDFETLWAIDQQCFEPGIAYSRFELGLYIKRAGGCTLVAEGTSDGGNPGSHGPIAGFVVAENGRRGVGHIITLDVLEHARRHGLGSRLLTAAEDRLRTGGCRGVVLETATDNFAAQAFYRRHQYVTTKTIPNYYSNGADALVLRKNL
jgi:ribosomal-protein-alanine N-acetyltransferase